MTSTDTIVAIATPLGVGGLGVVRISGSDAVKIANHIFSQKNSDLLKAASHTLHHGWIKNNSDVIDEVVAAVFIAPHSYTGENVVEFSCHGSPVVLKEVVELCIKAGARHAQPGEFTQRAYLNGKMDLIQAEAVASLIHAGSKAARHAAHLQLEGALSERIKTIRQSLVQFLAHIEANLDFVEEDIPDTPRTQMKIGLQDIKNEIDELIQTSVKGRILREGIRVAIIGKPNVGKSSLFNAILAQDRAIVTHVPGTTRDTLEEKMNWDGMSFVITDTAGMRRTKNVAEKKGTQRSKAAQKNADITLIVLDASQKLSPADTKILNESDPATSIVVFNKIDKQKRTQPKLKFRHVKISALKAKGLGSLKTMLVKQGQRLSPEVEDHVVVTQIRHSTQLQKAERHMNKALQAIEKNKSEESIAIDVRHALEAIGAITGESVTEDVLTSIFKQFCIGK